jgi:uncharacterized protein with HEPN domain
MKNKIADEIRLKHILDVISEIEHYTKNASIEDFTKNSMLKFASVNNWKLLEKRQITSLRK